MVHSSWLEFDLLNAHMPFGRVRSAGAREQFRTLFTQKRPLPSAPECRNFEKAN